MNDPVAKRVFLLLTGFFTLICVVGFASTQIKYKPWGVPDHRLKDYEQIVAKLQQRQRLMEAPQEGPQPAIFLAETVHDFGVVDPGSSHEHVFVVENRGEAPLALVASETSCKCAFSQLEETIVAPGEATTITLTWNAGSQQREHFRQFAMIATNDPKQPEVSVAVTGVIRQRLGFHPPALVADRVVPDESAMLSTVISSQLYDDFEVTAVESNLEHFNYFIDPVLPEQIEAMKAKAAYRLTVTLPVISAGESVHDQLTVTVRPSRAREEVQEEIALRVDVLPRIAFYGSGLDARDGLDLGVLTQGERGEQTLLVRVRGNLQSEPIQVLEVEPPCLRATLEGVNPQEGLYRLTIGVSEDTEPVAFRADRALGYVAVGNPRETRLQAGLPVRGQVIPEVK